MRNEKQWTNKEFRWESSRLRDISAKFSELYRYFSWEMKNSEQTRNFGESLVDYVIFQRNSVSFTGIFREKWKTVNKQGISLGKRKKVSWSGKKWDFRKISWDDKWGPYIDQRHDRQTAACPPLSRVWWGDSAGRLCGCCARGWGALGSCRTGRPAENSGCPVRRTKLDQKSAFYFQILNFENWPFLTLFDLTFRSKLKITVSIGFYV